MGHFLYVFSLFRIKRKDSLKPSYEHFDLVQSHKIFIHIYQDKMLGIRLQQLTLTCRHCTRRSRNVWKALLESTLDFLVTS